MSSGGRKLSESLQVMHGGELSKWREWHDLCSYPPASAPAPTPFHHSSPFQLHIVIKLESINLESFKSESIKLESLGQ